MIAGVLVVAMGVGKARGVVEGSYAKSHPHVTFEPNVRDALSF